MKTKVLVDTNILASVVFHPESRLAQILRYIGETCQLCLTEQIISELRRVIRAKSPGKAELVELLLAELPFAMVETREIVLPVVRIRDPSDQSILNAALLAGVDVILTNDHDFWGVKTTRPVCLGVEAFMKREAGKPGFVV